MLVCWESAEFLSVLGKNSLSLEEGDTGRVILLWPRLLAAKCVCACMNVWIEGSIKSLLCVCFALVCPCVKRPD